ncbi:SSI family serine proteinase inhibitor [Streptosporangium longisporum]|uniref:Subtilisin inhibitor domain-containing protein n=1 Tax=Streptosporangium longisporum TaxID=46187 RepID=A0ABP6L803_9ACTN
MQPTPPTSGPPPWPPRPNPGPPWGQPPPPRPRPPWPPWPPRPDPWPPRPVPPIVIPPDGGRPVVGPYRRELALTVTETGRTRRARLGCAPIYGTHPRAADACGVLSRAQGDPALIRLPWRGCPQYYDAVTATATGLWNGRQIRYSRTFSNRCELYAATGPVFAF